MDRKQLIYIFIASLLISISANEFNLAHIRSVNPTNNTSNTTSLVHESTIWSNDNSFYLPQMQNLMDGKGFTSDPSEPEMMVRRTPGYPLFYGAFYFVFGEKTAHYLIPYGQTLLFALSSVLLAMSVFYLFKNKKWAIITGYTYAINPFIYSYCYFTITESLFPFLVVLSLFFFARFVREQKKSDIILCGIICALSFLTRATSGVIILGIGAYLLFYNQGLANNFKQKSKTIVVYALSFVLTISPWVIRNYAITNELIIAEKFYHEAPMQYGKGAIELRFLTGCWTNPANVPPENLFHKLEPNIINNEPEKNIEILDAYLAEWPESAYSGYTKSQLKNALISMNNCFVDKNAYNVNHPSAIRKDKMTLPCEMKVFNEFNALKNSYINNSPIRYYVLTPLITCKEVIFNSVLHNIAAFNPADRNLSPFQFIAKSITYILNSLFYLSLLYFVVFSKLGKASKLLLLTPVVVLMAALTLLLFRYVELRYLLPIYPFLIISFSFMVTDTYDKVLLKVTSNVSK